MPWRRRPGWGEDEEVRVSTPSERSPCAPLTRQPGPPGVLRDYGVLPEKRGAGVRTKRPPKQNRALGSTVASG